MGGEKRRREGAPGSSFQSFCTNASPRSQCSWRAGNTLARTQHTPCRARSSERCTQAWCGRRHSNLQPCSNRTCIKQRVMIGAREKRRRDGATLVCCRHETRSAGGVLRVGGLGRRQQWQQRCAPDLHAEHRLTAREESRGEESVIRRGSHERKASTARRRPAAANRSPPPLGGPGRCGTDAPRSQ